MHGTRYDCCECNARRRRPDAKPRRSIIADDFYAKQRGSAYGVGERGGGERAGGGREWAEEERGEMHGGGGGRVKYNGTAACSVAIAGPG